MTESSQQKSNIVELWRLKKKELIKQNILKLPRFPCSQCLCYTAKLVPWHHELILGTSFALFHDNGLKYNYKNNMLIQMLHILSSFAREIFLLLAWEHESGLHTLLPSYAHFILHQEEVPDSFNISITTLPYTLPTVLRRHSSTFNK